MEKYILIAEDDEDDVMLMRSAFLDVFPTIRIEFVKDGVELLEYLENIEDGRYPSLLVLDLNMPKKNGREVLADIHTKDYFSKFKTVILSTTNKEATNFSLHEFAIHDFYVKPTSYEGLSEIVVNFCEIIGLSSAVRT